MMVNINELELTNYKDDTSDREVWWREIVGK